ncbi:MAG: hypothetical protein HY820_24650 [Acidobacteria bacterium]|nr:hypothetical protein [Acidobacteriota bacterium]
MSTNRLLKRHKRQVARAKANAKTSEPDVRTPEQIRAAREASRPQAGRTGSVTPLYSTAPRSMGGHAGSKAKTDA